MKTTFTRIALRGITSGLAGGIVVGSLVGLTVGLCTGAFGPDFWAILYFGAIGLFCGFFYGLILGALLGAGFGLTTALACQHFTNRVEDKRISEHVLVVNAGFLAIVALISLYVLVTTGGSSAIIALLVVAIFGPLVCLATKREISKLYGSELTTSG